MTSPTTQYTPVFQLPSPGQGQPLFETRQILEDLVEALEAVLLTKAVSPPGASDLAALAGRVTVLEQKLAASAVTARATSASSGTPLAVPGGSPYTAVPLTAPAVGADPFGFWSSAAPTRLKVPAGQGGRYSASAVAAFAAGAAGAGRFAELRVNGTTVAGSGTSSSSPPSINHVFPLPVTVLTLAATDYVELWVYSAAAATLSTTAGQTCALQLHRIGNS